MFQVLTARQLGDLGLSRTHIGEAESCCLLRVRRDRFVIARTCDREHHQRLIGLSSDKDTTFPRFHGDIRDRAERLRLQIACRRDSLLPGDVFSHVSAALIHGLDPVLTETDRVEVSRSSPTRSYDSLYVYSRDVPPGDVSEGLAYPVTTLARTLTDTALGHCLEVSVPLISQALRAGTVSAEAIAGRLTPGQRGVRRARLALALSSPAYEASSEALCAVKFHRHGITGMIPQIDAFSPTGEFIGRNDFRHESAPVAVEVHGLGKFYLTPDGPDEASKRSHQRNMNLLNAGLTVFNLSFGDLFRPRIFADIRRSIERHPLPVRRETG